jgi:hypothetical protein
MTCGLSGTAAGAPLRHRCGAVVVLPDRLHVRMTLPAGDADDPNRRRLIKRRSTDAVVKAGAPIVRQRKGGA